MSSTSIASVVGRAEALVDAVGAAATGRDRCRTPAGSGVCGSDVAVTTLDGVASEDSRWGSPWSGGFACNAGVGAGARTSEPGADLGDERSRARGAGYIRTRAYVIRSDARTRTAPHGGASCGMACQTPSCWTAPTRTSRRRRTTTAPTVTSRSSWMARASSRPSNRRQVRSCSSKASSERGGGSTGRRRAMRSDERVAPSRPQAWRVVGRNAPRRGRLRGWEPVAGSSREMPPRRREAEHERRARMGHRTNVGTAW